jgi:hypothetical protein
MNINIRNQQQIVPQMCSKYAIHPILSYISTYAHNIANKPISDAQRMTKQVGKQQTTLLIE